MDAWDNAEYAARDFDFGAGYRAIDGIGDRGKNVQSLGEIDVLSGRYILSVSLYSELVSEAELEAAIEIARIALGRLP